MISIFTIHIIVSLLHGLLGIRKINRHERFCNFIIALFIPVGGYIIVLVLYILRESKTETIGDDNEFEDPAIIFTDRMDREKEINVLSIEEALLVSNLRDKREQLISVLKRDTSRYIDKLKFALRDEDSETSHYAAAAVSEISRNLDIKLQAMAADYEKHSSDPETIRAYKDVLAQYLSSGLVDNLAKKRFLNDYVNIVEKLFEIEEESSHDYEVLVDSLIELSKYNKAELYSKKYLEKYPIEEAYMLNLKLLYIKKDKLGFGTLFKELLDSDIKLSTNGLQIVRFWLEGD